MAVNEQVIIELVARTEAAEKQIAALTEQLNKTKVAAKKASEDGLEKLTKNGGAMAILNDLTGGLAMQFKDAYESIQLTNTGLKGMKAALLATGIGALVVTLGLIVANFDQISDWFTGTGRRVAALEEENKKFKDRGDMLSKQLVELEGQENSIYKIVQLNRQRIENEIQILQNEKQIAIELGDQEKKSEAMRGIDAKRLELAKLINQETNRRNTVLEDARALVDEDYAKEREQYKIGEKFRDEQKEGLTRMKELTQEISELNKDIREADKRQAEAQARGFKEDLTASTNKAKAQAKLNEANAEFIKLQEEQKLLRDAITKSEEIAAKAVESKAGSEAKVTEEIKKQAFVEEEPEDEDPQVGFTVEQQYDLANFKAVRDEKLKKEEEFNAQMDAIQDKQLADDAKRNEAIEQGRKMMDDLRIQGAFATLSTIADLSELFAGESEKSQRKAFAVNKAASIATATAQTYLSAVAAYNSQLVPLDPTSPVRASIAAGIAIASGLVNVAKISATKFGGGPSGGGGSTPSIPGGGAPTPTNPQAALDFSFLSQQQQPVQTYVIAGDVTNAQEANQKLKDQSAL